MDGRRLQIEEYVDSMFDEDGPGLAVAVFANGKLLASHTRGRIDLESRLPIDNDTAFHAASLSKQFTAYAIAQLIVDGAMRLQDEVGLYLTFLSPEMSRITLAQLLFHTNGISDQWALLNLAGWNDHELVKTEDIIRIINNQTKLKNLPGTRFSYTNTGYTLLGQIVEILVGQSLDAHLQASLFRPAGMFHTRFRSDISTKLPFEADCYSRDREGNYTKSTPLFATVGATSLQTSLIDLSLWAKVLSERSEAVNKLLRERGSLEDGSQLPYGFGLYHGMVGDVPALSHSGWDADFSSHFVYLPEIGVGAAVLSNGSRTNLELVALSFLCDFVNIGKASAHIAKRISALVSDLGPHQRSFLVNSQRQAYGSIATGDVRIWERDAMGDSLADGALQPARLLEDGSYMLGVSLSTLEVTRDAITISSPTQSVRQTLPIIPLNHSRQALIGECSYFSKELNVTHSFIEEDGNLYWYRPGHEPSRLEIFDDVLFFAEGFSLRLSNEKLIIHSARTAPILFERIKDPVRIRTIKHISGNLGN